MRILTTCFLASFIFAIAAASAASKLQIVQKNKSFGTPSIEAKLGDEIEFVNGDKFAHNVFSQDIGFRFNTGLMRPGEAVAVRPDQTGSFVARCAIHPKMKMTVTVKD